jgi:GT2 family glycosyltransferase
MVVCNVERFLAEAIESILNQSLADFEFVIVDFGSTDGSKAIVSRYQEKDRRIKSQSIPRCRLAEARNASCALVQSPYIAIMDSDDIAYPDRLKRQVEFLDEHPEVGILGGGIDLIDTSGRILRTRLHPAQDEGIKGAIRANQFPFSHPTVVMRRELFNAVGGYRTPFDSGEDFDLWIRIGERSKLANLPAAVVKYRIHPSQDSFQSIQRQIYSAFAARVSSAARTKGLPDPLESVKEITPEVVAGMGVTEEAIENALLLALQERINLTVVLKFDVPVLDLVGQMLAKLAESKHVENSVAAAVWLAAARAYLSRHRFVKAGAAATHALLIHPPLAMDVVRRGLRRLAH